MAKIALEAALSFHESRSDTYLAQKTFALSNNATVKTDYFNFMQRMLIIERDQQLSITTEVDLLQEYIRLYQLVWGEQLFIRMETKIDVQKQLPALLLFPLITNAIQQGYNSMEKYPIKVKVFAFEQALSLEISNRVNHYIHSQEQTRTMDHYKQRLLHLFPDRHTLMCNSNSQTFKATLRLLW